MSGCAYKHISYIMTIFNTLVVQFSGQLPDVNPHRK